MECVKELASVGLSPGDLLADQFHMIFYQASKEKSEQEEKTNIDKAASQSQKIKVRNRETGESEIFDFNKSTVTKYDKEGAKISFREMTEPDRKRFGKK